MTYSLFLYQDDMLVTNLLARGSDDSLLVVVAGPIPWMSTVTFIHVCLRDWLGHGGVWHESQRILGMNILYSLQLAVDLNLSMSWLAAVLALQTALDSTLSRRTKSTCEMLYGAWLVCSCDIGSALIPKSLMNFSISMCPLNPECRSSSRLVNRHLY